MRTRKYRIRPAPNTENEWIAEYSYLGLIWRSVRECYAGYETYTTKEKARTVIYKDIQLRKAIAEHQTKGSERYP